MEERLTPIQEHSWSTVLLPFLIQIGIHIVKRIVHKAKVCSQSAATRQGIHVSKHMRLFPLSFLLSISSQTFAPITIMKVLWRLKKLHFSNLLQLLTGAWYREEASHTCWTQDLLLTVFKIFYASHKATRLYFLSAPNPNLLMERILISNKASSNQSHYF